LLWGYLFRLCHVKQVLNQLAQIAMLLVPSSGVVMHVTATD
jgi:hypothetical protein